LAEQQQQLKKKSSEKYDNKTRNLYDKLRKEIEADKDEKEATKSFKLVQRKNDEKQKRPSKSEAIQSPQ